MDGATTNSEMAKITIIPMTASSDIPRSDRRDLGLSVIVVFIGLVLFLIRTLHVLRHLSRDIVRYPGNILRLKIRIREIWIVIGSVRKSAAIRTSRAACRARRRAIKLYAMFEPEVYIFENGLGRRDAN